MLPHAMPYASLREREERGGDEEEGALVPVVCSCLNVAIYALGITHDRRE